MTETQNDRALQPMSPEGGATLPAGGRRRAFMRSLAAASYEEQVQMLRPPDPPAREARALAPAVTPAAIPDEPMGAPTVESGPALAAPIQFTGEGGESTTNTTPAPVNVTWPQNDQEYIAHIESKFSSQIQALKKAGEEVKQRSAEAERSSQVLKDYTTEIEELEQQLKAGEGTLDEKARKQLEAKLRATSAAQAHVGESQEDLRRQVEEILGDRKDKIEAKKVETKAERAKLSEILLASITLGSQLNPEFAEDARSFYMKTLDKEENGRLVAEADAAGASSEEVARLAVMYRNAAKDYVRQQIMVDENAREVLYLRDLGIYGRRSGLSFEEACAKAEADLEIDLDSATTPEEREAYLERIYRQVIGKAKETNPGVNAATGASKTE